MRLHMWDHPVDTGSPMYRIMSLVNGNLSGKLPPTHSSSQSYPSCCPLDPRPSLHQTETDAEVMELEHGPQASTLSKLGNHTVVTEDDDFLVLKLC